MPYRDTAENIAAPQLGPTAGPVASQLATTAASDGAEERFLYSRGTTGIGSRCTVGQFGKRNFKNLA